MNSKKIIDISKINVWISYLLPYSPDKMKVLDDETILKDQKKFIENNCFVMGWPLNHDYPDLKNGDALSDNTRKIYKQHCENDMKDDDNHPIKGYYDEASKKLDDFEKVKINDIVIARLKDGHYYVGEVSENATYMWKRSDQFNLISWGARVVKWYEIKNQMDVPSEVVGRFSQRYHPTIQCVSNDSYRVKLLILAMFDHRREIYKEKAKYNIPKVKLNKNNVRSSLSAFELEDMVSLFITERHYKDGYRLMPSTCKTSEQKYEFYFVAKEGNPVSCQVKNNAYIDVENYKDETSFEMIYLFSGKWNDECIRKLHNKYIDDNHHNHLYFISRQDLFDTVSQYKLYNTAYYEERRTTDIIGKLTEDGWVKRKNRGRKYKKMYSVYDEDANSIYFEPDTGWVYSLDFDCLINLSDTKQEKKELLPDFLLP